MVVIYGITMATIYYRNERDSDWIWLLAYEFFWIISLSWVMPYAALSLRNTGWLTRGNVTKPKRRYGTKAKGVIAVRLPHPLDGHVS